VLAERLLAPSQRLPALAQQLPVLAQRLLAPSQRLPALAQQLPVLAQRLPAPAQRLTANLTLMPESDWGTSQQKQVQKRSTKSLDSFIE